MYFDKELEDILQEYPISQMDMTRYEIFPRALEIIKHQFSTKWKDKKIAVYGGGEHTRRVLKILSDTENIICIVDKRKEDETIDNIPVIRLEELDTTKVDSVFVSSFTHRHSMIQIIREYYPELEMFDLYEQLTTEGYVISEPFYALNMFRKILDLNVLLRRYYDSTERAEKEKLLRNMIFFYFYIRDFGKVIKYCGIYCSENYSQVWLYKEFSDAVQRMCQKIGKKIGEQKREHVIIFLVDALGQHIVKQMPELQEAAGKAYSFDYYISEYPSTYPTMISLLTGWHNFDNAVYNVPYLTWEDDSELLLYLGQRGYGFHYIGGDAPYDGLSMDGSKHSDYLKDTSAECYYKLLNAIMEEDRNSLFIVHTSMEVHAPHFSADTQLKITSNQRERSYAEWVEQFEEAVKYCDELLMDYYRLLENSGNDIVICGDHGLELPLEYAIESRQETRLGYWRKESMNPALIVKSSLFGQGKTDRIVATYDFNQLVLSLFEKDRSRIEKTMDKEYVKLQFFPGYDRSWINNLIESGNYRIALGAVGIWNKQETYLLFEDGQELYLVNEDNREKNRAAEPRFKERMALCRKLAGGRFPDEIMESDKFRLHKEIMDGLGRGKLMIT